MTRIALLALTGGLVALTTACELPREALDHQSTLSTTARGIVLHDSNSAVDDDAQVGMSGTTCEVDTTFGSVGSDHNYPGDAESVDDIVVTPSGDTQVIVTGDNSVHIQESPDGWSTDVSDHHVPGALESKGFEDGAIVLTDAGDTGCGLTTVRTLDDGTSRLKPELCAGVHTLETDPTAGLAWVGSDSGLWQYDGQDVVIINEQPANLVAYDPYTDGLYTAELGSTTVRAIEADGSVRWTAEVAGSIYSIDDVGAEEAVAVSFNYEDGSGTGGVTFLDGWTGEVKADQFVNTANNRVFTSRDGSKLALDNGSRVDFYGVNPNFQGSGGWDWGEFEDTDIEWSF